MTQQSDSSAEHKASLQDDVGEVSVRLSRTKTMSGIETDAFYGPKERTAEYDEKLGDPGEFPFTRGSFPEMYRSRMWTLRNIVGYGSPDDTADAIAASVRGGSAAVDVVFDVVSTQGLDPDHPVLREDVGLEGASVSSLNDLDRLLRDIDVTKTDVAWHITYMIYPMVIAHARRHNLPLAEVHGSHMPDYLRINMDGGGQKFFNAQFGQRLAADTLEFATLNTPRWAAGLPQAYNLRERGCTPAMEIAVGMAIARSTFGDVLSRGIDIDDVAPHLAWVSTADIDLFEEVAKFRALRRMWAKMMREEFGAQGTRSMRLRIACHTSGRSLVYQRAMNNVTRAAIQTLAAILGGVQSVETCTYDEPISIPTPEARELATFTQLILAHEVGAARTADPLGGSYYVESLTDQVEARAYKLLETIEEHGFLKGIDDGWLEGLMDDENYRREEELASGERVVIGVNAFRPTDEEDRPPRFKVNQARVDDHIRRFVQERDARDPETVRAAMQMVFDSARGSRNTQDAMADAYLAGATSAEISGAQRLACGMQYDPFGAVEAPFKLL